MTPPFRPDFPPPGLLQRRQLSALPAPGDWFTSMLSSALGAPPQTDSPAPWPVPEAPRPAALTGIPAIMANAPQPQPQYGTAPTAGYPTWQAYRDRLAGTNRQLAGGVVDGLAHIPADLAATPDMIATENLAPMPQYVRGVPVAAGDEGPSLAQILARNVRPWWDKHVVHPLESGAGIVGDVVSGGAPVTQDQADARGTGALLGNLAGWEFGARGLHALNELRQLRNETGLFRGDALHEPTFQRLLDELPNRSDGFTYDPRTGEMAQTGIMVGGHPAQVGGGNANPVPLTDARALRDFLLNNRRTLAQPGVMVGGWGQPEGMILDLANDAGDVGNAMQLMNARNEKAAFNLGNMTEIQNPHYNAPSVAEVATGRDAAGNVVTNRGRVISDPNPPVAPRNALPNTQAPAPTGSLMFDRPLLNDAGEIQRRGLLRVQGPAEQPRPGMTPAEVPVATDAAGNVLTNHGRVMEQSQVNPAAVRMVSHTTKTVPMEGTPFGVGDEHTARFALPDGNEVTVLYSRPEGGTDLRVRFVGSTGGDNSVGAANTRAIQRQLVVQNPGVESIGGRRISGARVASGSGAADMSVDVRPRPGLLAPAASRAARGGTSTLGGMVVGGAGGAATGGQIGDTPEERLRNAFIGGGLGMVFGGAAGLGLSGRAAEDAAGAGLLGNRRGAVGDVLASGLERDAAVAKMKELDAAGQRAQMRRDKDGSFSVVAKGERQTPKAGLMATTEPKTPVGLLGPDTDTGFSSRLFNRVRTMENVPDRGLTLDEWRNRLKNDPNVSQDEVNATLRAMAKDHPAVAGEVEKRLGELARQRDVESAPLEAEMTEHIQRLVEAMRRVVGPDAADVFAANLAGSTPRGPTPRVWAERVINDGSRPDAETERLFDALMRDPQYTEASGAFADVRAKLRDLDDSVSPEKAAEVLENVLGTFKGDATRVTQDDFAQAIGEHSPAAKLRTETASSEGGQPITDYDIQQEVEHQVASHREYVQDEVVSPLLNKQNDLLKDIEQTVQRKLGVSNASRVMHDLRDTYGTDDVRDFWDMVENDDWEAGGDVVAAFKRKVFGPEANPAQGELPGIVTSPWTKAEKDALENKLSELQQADEDAHDAVKGALDYEGDWDEARQSLLESGDYADDAGNTEYHQYQRMDPDAPYREHRIYHEGSGVEAGHFNDSEDLQAHARAEIHGQRYTMIEAQSDAGASAKYTNTPGNPFMTTERWTQLSTGASLRDAAKERMREFAWPTAQNARERASLNLAAGTATYEQGVPKALKRIYAALGEPLPEVHTKRGLHVIALTPQVRAKIVKYGVPALGVGGLLATSARPTQPRPRSGLLAP